MSSNFSPFPNGNMIQGALALEPRENTLNRLALLQKRLAFKGVLYPIFPKQSLMACVDVDYRGGPVLSLYQSEKGLANPQ